MDIAGNAAPPEPDDSFVTATRALLRVRSAGDVRDVAVRLVEDLGATTTTADADDGTAVPIDISFGAGPVLLPAAEAASVERMLVERFLPLFVEDAHRALALVLHTDQLTEDASVDPLTGLANRRASGRVLGRLHENDAVALVDLDHFKQVNDTLGHEEGDRVLRAFGQFLRSHLRGRDHAGRHGGEEFLIVLPGTSAEAAAVLLGRLRASWEEERPHPVGFSVGVAFAAHGGDTLVAADRALYREGSGPRPQRDRTRGGLHVTVAKALGAPPAPETASTFVALSELTVAEDGRDALIAAFRSRLGAVESAAGFQRLEVWADQDDSTAFTMVSWWDSKRDFLAYMRSADHRRSHARIPTGDDAPRAARFRRFEQVAT